MYIRDIYRNPYVLAALSILTLGLFSFIWLFYLSIRLKTLKVFLYKPILAVSTILILIRHIFELFIVLIAAQWFAIPNKLAETREYNGLEASISWKIGLLPLLTIFYTFGFLFIHAPTRNLSDATIVAIGIPMLISVVFSLAIYVFIVQEKFKEYLEKREFDLAARKEKSTERQRRERPMSKMVEPYHSDEQEELPMLELSDFETCTQENNEFTLQFDDDYDDF
ncbi:MAG: hypothetical protein K8S87_08815 [Planctomycetes bacterium]|nr:hypothetical protein [Planctomycetota bacterium]